MNLQSLFSRKTTPPKAPDNFDIIITEDDDWQNPQASIPDEIIDGLTFGIEYCNAKNEYSRRRITLKSTDGDLINAYCHERKMPRCFNVNRIEHIINLQTGEVTGNARQFIESLSAPEKAHHARKYGHIETDKSQTNKAMGRIRDGGRILMWIARCDGHVPPEEIDAILEHYAIPRAEGYGEMEKLNDIDKGYIRKWVSMQYPDIETLKACITRIIKSDSETHKALLHDTIKKVIDADGRLAPEEVEAMLYFNEIFGEEEDRFYEEIHADLDDAATTTFMISFSA